MYKWIIRIRQGHREDFIPIEGDELKVSTVAKGYEKPGVIAELYKYWGGKTRLDRWAMYADHNKKMGG